MAAIVPEVPGNCRGVVLPPAGEPRRVVGVGRDAGVDADDDPHAAMATPAAPSADRASRRRTVTGRPVRRGPGSVTAARPDDLTGLYMVGFLLAGVLGMTGLIRCEVHRSG